MNELVNADAADSDSDDLLMSHQHAYSITSIKSWYNKIVIEIIKVSTLPFYKELWETVVSNINKINNLCIKFY